MKEQGERGRGCEGKRIIRIERGDEKKWRETGTAWEATAEVIYLDFFFFLNTEAGLEQFYYKFTKFNITFSIRMYTLKANAIILKLKELFSVSFLHAARQ